jgi:HRDC domain
MGGGQWEAKHVFVFRRLFLWREKEAEKRDESPSYICRGSLLLDAAEFLPTTISSLMKLQSPLPASMRSDTAAGGGGADGTVDLVGAINDALSVWDVVVRKQVSSPFAERVDGTVPEGHRDKHVPKIPVNGVRSYEKIESKPCITVHSDAVPSVVQTVLESDGTSDPSSKQIEGHCDIVNKSEKDAKNSASATSTSSATPASSSFSTSAFSGPALLFGAAVALGAMIVIRIRSR